MKFTGYAVWFCLVQAGVWRALGGNCLMAARGGREPASEVSEPQDVVAQVWYVEYFHLNSLYFLGADTCAVI